MNSLKVWDNSLANRSESTRTHYLHYFKKFVAWAGLSPDDLRDMKYREDQEARPWERNRVENLLRAYLKTLDERNLTCSTQNMVYNSVRSFFEAQGMPLFLRREDKPVGCAFGSKTLTREEIRRLKNAAEHLRDKALIMFLKDSGLRLSDAAKLKWSDFKDYGDGYLGFQIQTKKKKTKARGFVGSETTEILKLYKEKRLQGTKKIPPENDYDEHPVFSLLTDPARVFNSNLMSAALGSIVKLAGIEDATPHGLRKYWEQNVHFDQIAYQKQLNGRALTSVERAYYWKEVEDLFEMYRGNYHNLTIEKQDFREAENRLRKDYERETKSLRKHIYELERKNDELKTQLNDQKLTSEQVKALLRRIEKLEKLAK